MGCDIHLYREARVAGEWKSLDTWVRPSWATSEDEFAIPLEKQAYNDRNYDLFGTLAKGVRREPELSFEPRGLPLELSDLVAKSANQWDTDGHNHSYLYLHELIELRDVLSKRTIRIEGMKDAGELAALNESIAAGNPDWDKLYPYCASTNSPTYVPFEMDIPANFIVGGCLDKIIASFADAQGDTPRIVFWFDN